MSKVPEMAEVTFVTLGITQTLSLWTALAPDIHEVRKADPVNSHTTVQSLRTAELVVGTLAVVIATTAAMYINSPVPLIATGITILGVVVAYELTLRNTANLNTTN